MTEFKPGDEVLWRFVDSGEWFEGTVSAYQEGACYDDVLVNTNDNGPLYVSTRHLKKRGGFVTKDSPRSEILDEARTLITGDRNLSYGTPTQNFQNTADLWNVQLGHKLKDGEKFTGTDVALLMTHLKMARLIASGTKRDNYADAIGYMACAWETVVSDDSSE